MRTLIVLSIAGLALAACNSEPRYSNSGYSGPSESMPTAEDQATLQERQRLASSDPLVKGDAMISKGRRLIEQGKNTQSEGERLVEDGQRLIESNQMQMQSQPVIPGSVPGFQNQQMAPGSSEPPQS